MIRWKTKKNQHKIEQKVNETLAQALLPSGQLLKESGFIQSLTVDAGKVVLVLEVVPDQAGTLEEFRKSVEERLNALAGVKSAFVVLTAQADPSTLKEQRGEKETQLKKNIRTKEKQQKESFPNIKKIIAISSGKGGVGKSTTTVNLAVALKNKGLKVGILDADIYGPSIPTILGVEGQKPSVVGKIFQPIEKEGIKAISIGVLVDPEQAVAWRGPMVHSALKQLMSGTNWGELDVLLIDMPPGTGDVQISLTQRLNLSGAVIVSTPQKVALLDVRKGIDLFDKVSVPVLGVVENMSVFVCPDCGTHTAIFDQGKAQAEAEKQKVPFLGSIPLDLKIRQQADEGRWLAQVYPQSPQVQAYEQIAAKLCE